MRAQIKIETVSGRPIEEYGYKREFVEIKDFRPEWVCRAIAVQCLVVQRRGNLSEEHLKNGVYTSVSYVDEDGFRRNFQLKLEVPSWRVLCGQSNGSLFPSLLPDLIQPEVAFTVVQDGKEYVLHKIDLKTGEQREFEAGLPPQYGVKPGWRFVDWEKTGKEYADEAVKVLNDIAKKFTPTQHDVNEYVSGLFRVWSGEYVQIMKADEELKGESRKQVDEQDLEP